MNSIFSNNNPIFPITITCKKLIKRECDYGVDYSETFAPVAKMNTIRGILSLAANYYWNLNLFDMQNAFLYG